MVICPYQDAKEIVQFPEFENYVTVLVGPQEKKYVLHKNVLTAMSKFFAAALRPGVWKEEQEGVIRMPEDDHEIFTMYAECLYTGICRTKFIEAEIEEGPRSLSFELAEDTEWLLLAKAYVFGDKIQDPIFKVRSIDLLASRLAKSCALPSDVLITFVYKSTASNSPLRRLICDVFVYEAPPGAEELDDPQELEFFRDLAKFSRIAFQKLQFEKDMGIPYMTNTCLYHGHD